MNSPKRSYQLLLLVLAALVVSARTARADLTSYSFGVGYGSGYDMSDATQLLGPGSDDDGTDLDIGFTFYLDGVAYNHFSVSSNGLIGFGAAPVTTCWENLLNNTGSGCGDIWAYTLSNGVPQVAPFWDDMAVSSIDENGDPADGSISYKVFGDAPHRVLVVEYRNMMIDYFNREDVHNYGSWQARFYEGSNKIEFWYEHMDMATGNYSQVDGFSGASIGIALSGSNYASVTPDGMGGASVSFSDVNDRMVLASTPIPDNTLYTFNPCRIAITGDVSQGGTADMLDGDNLLSGMSVQRGGSQDYSPFSINLDESPCTSRDYRFSITGPNASDYQISPMSGTILATESMTPVITFSPTGNGERIATLTVTDDNGFSRSFQLDASATTRIAWAGNVPDGGTLEVNDGDTFLADKRVRRKESQGFQPITITNFNDNPAAPPALITYVINDPSGQFSINPASESLLAGESSSPTITFSPTGVGFQEATLTIIADGEKPRTFKLRAFSIAPGGNLLVDGSSLASNPGLFVGQTNCVGEYASSVPVTIQNIGSGDFTVNGVSFFATDTSYVQGAPPYKLLRDQYGNLIPFNDYVVTLTAGVAPLAANQVATFPIVIPENQSRTIYITYIGQLPGKRYARAFLRSNGENFSGADTASVGPDLAEGMLNFDVFGRAVGSVLSDNPAGGLPKTIVFASTQVGSSTDVTYTFTNAGQCDLRISRKHLQIVAGDVDEFKLINAFTGVNVDPATNDYLIPSGGSASVTVRFTPSRSGSRRASLWLHTNDSTAVVNGVLSRGDYYLDLFGTGQASQQGSKLSFGAAAMGIDKLDGVATFSNETTLPITITALNIGGTDASEFQAGTSPAWPTLPTTIAPGKTLNLDVRFAPAAAGIPGTRQGVLVATTSTSDMLQIPLEGIAGTRQMTTSPTTVNFPPSSVGKQTRQVITVTNSGTMPVTLSASPALSGTNMADFSLSAFPRLMLAPGQIEYLEVTYLPTTAGTSTATVTFNSDAAGGAQTVSLMAQASKTKLELNPSEVVRVTITGDPSSQPVSRSIAVRNEGDEPIRVTGVEFSGADAGQFRAEQVVGEIAGNSEAMLEIQIQPNGRDMDALLVLHAENVVTGEQVMRQVEVAAEQQRTSGVSLDAVAGTSTDLQQSTPNPTTGDVVIGYRLARSGDVKIDLYDGSGHLVRVLVQGSEEQGEHQLHVNLGDLPSGVYHYRMNANGVSRARSLTILK